MRVSRFEESGPIRVVVAHENITEQKQAEESMRLLPSRLLAAQEKERERISSEIHDSIGQSLHAIKVGLTGLLDQDGALAKDARSLTDLLSTIDFAIGEVRSIYTGLRPSLLDDLGILAAMGWFLREFQSAHPDIRIVERISIQEAFSPLRALRAREPRSAPSGI